MMEKEEQEYTTISKIAKGLEFESMDKSDDGEPTISSRTMERNFKKLLKSVGISEEEVKDEKGSYRFEKDGEAIISAFLLETLRSDSYFRKIMNGKDEDISIEEIIDFFQAMEKETAGKMDKKERIDFLLKLDQSTQYSILAILVNINNTISALVKNIQIYPYEYQVQIMGRLFQKVFEQFNLEIKEKVEEHLLHKMELEEFMDSIEEDPREDE